MTEIGEDIYITSVFKTIKTFYGMVTEFHGNGISNVHNDSHAYLDIFWPPKQCIIISLVMET